MKKWVIALLLVAVWGVVLAQAQDSEPQELSFRGFLDEDEPFIDYEVAFDEGQAVLLVAEATSGDLDTVLELESPSGDLLFSNDDRSAYSRDSVIGFLSDAAGIYTVRVSRFPFHDNSGNFRLTITIGGLEVLQPLDDLTRYRLSGDEEMIESEHFVVYYTTRGSDAATEEYARAVSTTFEEVWYIQLEEMRWPQPPMDSLTGGDGRYDVFLGDLINDQRNALGVTVPRVRVGDNPNSPLLETRAATSYIVIENDFAEAPDDDVITLMRSTIAHEFHHAIQLGYDYRDEHRWYYEATAVYMETATLIKEQDAAAFVSYNFDYPELCFGTEVTDPGVGILIYGDWLFIQSLVDTYGEEVVQKLWQNIALYDGFAALEETLARYSDDVPTALTRYRLQNLVRDYDLAESFDATVFLEDIIDDTGRWTFNGAGIQELSANYFELDVRAGDYEVSLARESADLELWVIMITDDVAISIPLGQEGVVEVGDQDYTYLMVFNPTYDDDINDCTYEEYVINVERVNDAPTSEGALTWDATYFEPLNLRR
ncbi:MAG: hypothetical protein HXY40_12770 [Chloroflexi bacterium]|nr:hypothetical protein [Chloroflexota bacterium]